MATKTNHSPGWKARRTATRRADAEARQKIYDARPHGEKYGRAGKREEEKLLNKLEAKNGSKT